VKICDSGFSRNALVKCPKGTDLSANWRQVGGSAGPTTRNASPARRGFFVQDVAKEAFALSLAYLVGAFSAAMKRLTASCNMILLIVPGFMIPSGSMSCRMVSKTGRVSALLIGVFFGKAE